MQRPGSKREQNKEEKESGMPGESERQGKSKNEAIEVRPQRSDHKGWEAVVRF